MVLEDILKIRLAAPARGDAGVARDGDLRQLAEILRITGRAEATVERSPSASREGLFVNGRFFAAELPPFLKNGDRVQIEISESPEGPVIRILVKDPREQIAETGLKLILKSLESNKKGRDALLALAETLQKSPRPQPISAEAADEYSGVIATAAGVLDDRVLAQPELLLKNLLLAARGESATPIPATTRGSEVREFIARTGERIQALLEQIEHIPPRADAVRGGPLGLIERRLATEIAAQLEEARASGKSGDRRQAEGLAESARVFRAIGLGEEAPEKAPKVAPIIAALEKLSANTAPAIRSEVIAPLIERLQAFLELQNFVRGAGEFPALRGEDRLAGEIRTLIGNFERRPESRGSAAELPPELRAFIRQHARLAVGEKREILELLLDGGKKGELEELLAKLVEEAQAAPALEQGGARVRQVIVTRGRELLAEGEKQQGMGWPRLLRGIREIREAVEQLSEPERADTSPAGAARIAQSFERVLINLLSRREQPIEAAREFEPLPQTTGISAPEPATLERIKNRLLEPLYRALEGGLSLLLLKSQSELKIPPRDIMAIKEVIRRIGTELASSAEGQANLGRPAEQPPRLDTTPLIELLKNLKAQAGPSAQPLLENIADLLAKIELVYGAAGEDRHTDPQKLLTILLEQLVERDGGDAEGAAARFAFLDRFLKMSRREQERLAADFVNAEAGSSRLFESVSRELDRTSPSTRGEEEFVRTLRRAVAELRERLVPDGDSPDEPLAALIEKLEKIEHPAAKSQPLPGVELLSPPLREVLRRIDVAILKKFEEAARPGAAEHREAEANRPAPDSVRPPENPGAGATPQPAAPLTGIRVREGLRALIDSVAAFRLQHGRADTAHDETVLLETLERFERQASEALPSGAPAPHSAWSASIKKLLHGFNENLRAPLGQRDLTRDASFAQPLKSLDNILKGQEALRRLNPLVQAAGEPALLIFPTVLQSLISRMDILYYKGPQRSPEDEEEADEDGTGKKPAKRKNQSYDRVEVGVNLPALGAVQIYLLMRKAEVLLTLAFEKQSAADLVDGRKTDLARLIKSLGYERCEISVRQEERNEKLPAWSHELTRPGHLLA